MAKRRTPRAASDSVGAQLSMMRKRTTKRCENPTCGKKFEGLTIAKFCSDECRYQAAYAAKKTA